MENEPNEVEPSNIDPEEVRKAFDAAEKKAAETQDLASKAAQYAGYTRDVIHTAQPIYVHLAQLAQDMPQLRPFVLNGVQFVKSLEDELEPLRNQGISLVRSLSGSAVSSDLFINTTGNFASVIIPDSLKLEPFEPPPFFSPDQTEVEKKLSAIDPSLSDTYREIGQAYHGTTADPARVALALMRQVFDHFFEKLAPDDAVRASPYWSPKSGQNPDQVTRRERMTYAAYTHIHDKARAKTMVANLAQILETYQLLNKLHKRGTLSDKQTRSILKTMKKFIESWVDAMGL